MLATDGLSILPVPGPDPGGAAAETPSRSIDLLVPEGDLLPFETPMRRRTIRGTRCAIVRRSVVPRSGGPAHFVADLSGYKAGKSYGGALWLAGFAAVPYEVQLIGAEYSTSEPEFDYLSELLLSERGMNMHATKYLNDRRQGRMLIEFDEGEGATFEVKSWERKEALKGKRVLCYYFAEAYQLPGFECFTSIEQNLRELDGFACFTTTPDRPWVDVLHQLGHGADPDWFCTCENDAACNPFTFDQRARDRDDPEKGGIMTRERFAIAWGGKLGHFVGRVYDVRRQARELSPLTWPQIWSPAVLERILDARDSS